jgi:hypothetical protein
MESFVTVRAFLPFSSISSFGSRGICEGFCVPFLLRMCKSFPFFFIFRFFILMALILHSKCMHLWAFDFFHVDEIGLLLCQGFDKLLKSVNVYAIIIVLCISIDKSNIRTRSLRNTHSQETQHLSWETL